MPDRAQDTEAIRAALNRLVPYAPISARNAFAALARLVARLEAAERERDDLGPLFIRDACRILGVDEHDVYRMDALADRLAALAAAAPGETTLAEPDQWIEDPNGGTALLDSPGSASAAPGETKQTP